MRFRHYLLILTQVATNGFWGFCLGISAYCSTVFRTLSSPRRGAMSIENGIFKRPHPVGVLCL